MVLTILMYQLILQFWWYKKTDYLLWYVSCSSVKLFGWSSIYIAKALWGDFTFICNHHALYVILWDYYADNLECAWMPRMQTLPLFFLIVVEVESFNTKRLDFMPFNRYFCLQKARIKHSQSLLWLWRRFVCRSIYFQVSISTQLVW